LEIGKVIAWVQISEKADEPLRAIRRKRKAESDDAKDESHRRLKLLNMMLLVFRRKEQS
jgi:hypothetical protein